MNLPEAVVRWRGGEGAIGRPRAVDRAATQLGSRLGWLLRAMAALNGGSRVEVARVAEEARADGQAQVAEILDLLLAPKDKLDPTKIRKSAKARGLELGSTLPFLDLLRSLAVFRTGTESPAAGPLRDAARSRPALDLVVEMLTSRADRVSRNTLLDRYLMRAGQVLAVARAQRLRGRVHPGFLTANYDQDLLGLSHPTWSDLGGPTRGDNIARRIRGEEGWTDGHDDVAEWLYARSDKRRWLGPLVRAIGERLAAGRLEGLIGMIHAAAHLAWADPNLKDIARQLVNLESRMLWIQSGGDDDPVLACWVWKSRALSPAERLRLAERVLRSDDEEELNDHAPDVASQMATLVAARSADLDAVQVAVGGLDRTQIGEVVRNGAEPARAKLIEAWVALRPGSAGKILAAIPALVAGGQGPGAARMVRALDPGELKVGGAAEAARALAQVAGVEGLAALARVVPWLESVPEAVVAAAERGLAGDGPGMGAALAVLAAGGQGSVATARIRDEGRALRQLPAAAADLRAMTVLSAAFLYGEHAVTEVRQVTEPIARFVLRDGPDRALIAVRGLPDGLQPGGVTFFLQYRTELGSSEGWLNLVSGMSGPPLPDDLAPLLRDASRRLLDLALARDPATARALDDIIEGAFASVLDNFGAFGDLLGTSDLDPPF